MAFSLKKIQERFQDQGVTWTKVLTYCRANGFMDYVVYKENHSVKTMAVIKKEHVGAFCEYFGVQERHCDDFAVEGTLYSEIVAYQNNVKKSKEDCEKIRAVNTQMRDKITELNQELEYCQGQNVALQEDYEQYITKTKYKIEELESAKNQYSAHVEETSQKLKEAMSKLKESHAAELVQARQEVHKQYLDKKEVSEKRRESRFTLVLNIATSSLIIFTVLSCFIVFGTKTIETVVASIILSLVIILAAIVNSHLQKFGNEQQKKVSMILLAVLSLIELYFHGNSFSILLAGKAKGAIFISWIMALAISGFTACSIWFRRK